MVLAETVNETQSTETQDLTLPYDSLLEAPTEASSESQEATAVEDAPVFSLETEAMTGTVGETTDVVILVDRPTNQLQVTIPQELVIQMEEMPEDLEVNQMSATDWLFTADESKKFTIPVSSEIVGEFSFHIEDELDGTIIFKESEKEESISEETVDETKGIPSYESDRTFETVEKYVENGVKDVASWVEFVQAFSDKEVTKINVISDFETPDNPRAGLSNITSGNSDNPIATERFVYLNQSRISRKLTIEGNKHQIDFRSIMLGFNNVTADQKSPWEIELKDLEIYHGNWYGPISLINLSSANQMLSSITYNNISSYGNQLLCAPFTDVYIRGNVINHQMATYTSNFRTWRINATNQANFEVSNVTVLEDATLDLKTINSGNIDVLNGGIVTMKKGAYLSAEANGFGGEIEGLNILLRNGSFILEEDVIVDLRTQELRGGIGFNSSNSEMIIGKNSVVNLYSSGTKGNLNGIWWNPIWMQSGSRLAVEDSGELNILATGMGSSPANIIYVNGNAHVSVGKDATLDIKSDSTSISQSLLYFASTGSSFTFADAERVNLERTGIIAGTSKVNGLIRIEGSTGLLDVDVQSVKQWARGNFEEDENFSWKPIFNLNLRYTGVTPRITSVASIDQETVNDFSTNFTTQNVQRILFEKIPDVEVTINSLTGDPSQTNSYRITGTATPKSLVRFSGDPAIPEGTLDSPNTSDDEAFHVMADENGTYQYDLPDGVRFTSGNEVIAYAFLDGKTDTASTIVEEYTPNIPVSPVDPLEPELEVSPENKPEIPEDQGLLSIDFVSQFNFGTQSISSLDKTYYAQPQRLLNEEGEVIADEERPNYVQISDRRSDTNRVGWEISVIQNTQFKNDDGDELAGAQLRFMNQQLATAQGGSDPSIRTPEEVILIPEQKQILLTADEETGFGTWIYRFGDKESSDRSVALDVPRYSSPTASIYQTKLIWELSCVPENK